MSVPLSEQLARTFGPHLEQLCARTARALAACQYEALLVHSGALLEVFEDDRTYPYEAHAPFKVWAPLADAPDSFVWFRPGERPRLLVHQPRDYWYKAAASPSGYWVEHFDVRSVADRAAARQALPRDLGRTAYIGDRLPELPACGQREQELPYNPIIALNEGGAVLHYQLLERRPPPARYSLLIDAGAEFAGYACDITRTHAAEEGDFANLIRRMDRMQQGLCAQVRAGVDWRDIQLAAHTATAEVLREADLILCGAQEAVERGVTRVFLPHGIGHLLGLEVHDVGGFMSAADGPDVPPPAAHRYLRLTRVLEPGFVVTMEPGIYFIDQLLDEARADERASRINWARVGELSRYGGIRIEDDLAVEAGGAENLTRDAFRAIAT